MHIYWLLCQVRVKLTCVFPLNDFQYAACSSPVVWQKGGSFCRVLRGGQWKRQSNFWHVQIGFQVSSLNSTSSDFDTECAWTVIGLNSLLFCCRFLWCSCVSRISDKKLQNTVDLFSEINLKVCVTYIIVNCMCAISFTRTWHMFLKPKASSNLLCRNPNTSAPTGQCCVVWEKHNPEYHGLGLPNSRKR